VQRDRVTVDAGDGDGARLDVIGPGDVRQQRAEHRDPEVFEAIREKAMSAQYTSRT
jgi:hypothetical protein